MASTITSSRIKTAAMSDEARVVGALVLAFGADPVGRWLYPDPQQYLSYAPDFIRAFAGQAFAHETAYYVDGYAGAALWLPPGGHPDEDGLVALIERSAAGRDQAELFAVLEQMEGYHPSEPHWYLPLIGVDPTQQGRGYGSALLQHTLARCDRDNMLAYLEASSPRNRLLYERHGFEMLASIQFGKSPTIWPMVRQPRAL
ncbi:MAG: GNAT family N-acetyltransferase [Thermomicrobiales bacterium]